MANTVIRDAQRQLLIKAFLRPLVGMRWLRPSSCPKQVWLCLLRGRQRDLRAAIKRLRATTHRVALENL